MKKGSKMTLEQRNKLSESHKGKKLSEEQKEKMKGRIPWNKGKRPSNETIEKQKQTHKTTLLAHPEIGKKISLANKGKTSWNKGIPMNASSKIKMAEGVKKAWSNTELRKKQSENHKGFHNSTKTQFKKGQTSWMKGKHFSKETINKIRQIRSTPEYREIKRKQILAQFKSNNFPNVQNTKPERQLKEELLKRGYKEGEDFIHQYKFMDKFMCDFCFPKQKIIIEVDGDYWHCNPEIYSSPKNQQQIKGINKDKGKKGYIEKADNGSWTLLRFWENDINKNVVECADKIEEVIRERVK